MAPWLIPALKAVLPHVGTILQAAGPVFTRKKPVEAGGADTPALVQQQIAELQAAASQNAANIKELAAQLQGTVAALEQAALVAEARLRRALLLCGLAAAVSLISLAAVIVLMAG